MTSLGKAVGALSSGWLHLKQDAILAKLICPHTIQTRRPKVNTPNNFPQFLHFFALHKTMIPQLGHGFFLPPPLSCLNERRESKCIISI